MSYKTRDGMLSAWNALVINHPDLVSSEVVGHTVEGRNIPLYKIGNPSGSKVMFSGATHGFEKAGVEVLLMFADWVVNSSDAEAKQIREKNCLLILPVLDLDGYPNTSGMNKNAVNLHRNFNFRWGLDNAGHTPGHSCSNKLYTTEPECLLNGGTWNIDWTVWTQYCGPSVESEPETRALKYVWLKYLPRNYCDVHVGSSGYYIWFSWLADNADRDHMIAVGKKYLARSPVKPYGWGENAASSGCPVSASYHNSSKRIWGYVIEVCTQNPVFATIISDHYPNFKEVAITLCQDSVFNQGQIQVPPPIPLWKIGTFVVSTLGLIGLSIVSVGGE